MKYQFKKKHNSSLATSFVYHSQNMKRNSIQACYFIKFSVNLRIDPYLQMDTILHFIPGHFNQPEGLWDQSVAAAECIHLCPATHPMAARSTLCNWIWLKSNIRANWDTVAIISLIQTFDHRFLFAAFHERSRLLYTITLPYVRVLGEGTWCALGHTECSWILSWKFTNGCRKYSSKYNTMSRENRGIKLKA